MPLTHIAIIPDGNRRWAKENKVSTLIAYKISTDYKKAQAICEEAKKQGAKYLSIWGFSTENWKRSKKEIREIFKIIKRSLDSLEKDSKKNKYRFICLGRRDRIPKDILKKIETLEKETKDYDKFNIIFCIDYGGRDEIVRAVKKIIREDIKEINEKSFAKYLDTKEIPDPDLVIRTAGEKRLSGFMPFQTAYSEFYFTKTLFPAFGVKELREAIRDFKERKRNFGE